jgi:hypothetical protein
MVATEENSADVWKKGRTISNIKCDKCKKVVRNGILCDSCDLWNHFRCANVSEDNIPDEKSEWLCPRCSTTSHLVVPDEVSLVSLDSKMEEANLMQIISLLRQDIQVLKAENEKLKSSISGVDAMLIESVKAENEWETVPTKKTSKRRSVPTLDDTNFPVLSNRFSSLSVQSTSSNSNSESNSVITAGQVIRPNRYYYHHSRPNL